MSSKSFFIGLFSVLLLLTLSYFSVVAYRYYTDFGGVAAIPQEVMFPFLLRAFVACFIIFAGSLILLSRFKRKEKDFYSPRQAFNMDVFDQDSEPLSGQQRYTLDGDKPGRWDATQYQENKPEKQQKKKSDPSRSYSLKSVLPEDLSGESTNSPQNDSQPNFFDKLKQEVEYSTQNTYELALVLLQMESLQPPSRFETCRQVILRKLEGSAFIFPYTEKNTLAIIMPFYSSEEVQKLLVSLFESLREELENSKTTFKAGFTSKYNRYIEAEVLLYECEIAFEKTLEADQFCILGFEPDISKYEQYYSS